VVGGGWWGGCVGSEEGKLTIRLEGKKTQKRDKSFFRKKLVWKRKVGGVSCASGWVKNNQKGTASTMKERYGTV